MLSNEKGNFEHVSGVQKVLTPASECSKGKFRNISSVDFASVKVDFNFLNKLIVTVGRHLSSVVERSPLVHEVRRSKSDYEN